MILISINCYGIIFFLLGYGFDWEDPLRVVFSIPFSLALSCLMYYLHDRVRVNIRIRVWKTHDGLT